MDLKLKDKTVFISGSTSGIGYCAAKIFLQEEAVVYINGRTQQTIDKAIAGLKVEVPYGTVHGIVADFSDAESIGHLIAQLPAIDILINNVGIYTSKSFFDTTDEEWQHHLEVNVMSGVRLSRSVLPTMIKNNWGRILFISSECASLVPEDLIAYSTSKTAVLAISRGLAQLTKGTAVTVNTILPGSTKTKAAEQFISNMAAQKNQSVDQVETEFFKEARPGSLLQRFASVEEIANTIVYYSSPLAAATNGAAIKLDGGSMGGVI